MIALEYPEGKPGRGCAKIIDDYSAKSLITIFDVHINREAKITTDGWSGYKPLKRNTRILKRNCPIMGRILRCIIFKSETSKIGLDECLDIVTKAL